MKILSEHYAGSIAYGTSNEGSDIDIRGIFIPELSDKLIGNYNNTIKVDGNEDKMLFELSFFIDLCIENNPNILETLFVDRKHILKTSESYELLRKHRNEFLSKKVFNTYLGFAKSQIKRLENHKLWIDNDKNISGLLLKQVGINNDSDILLSNENNIELLIKEKGLNIKDFSMLVKPKKSDYLKIYFNFNENKFNNSMKNQLKNNLQEKIYS